MSSGILKAVDPLASASNLYLHVVTTVAMYSLNHSCTSANEIYDIYNTFRHHKIYRYYKRLRFLGFSI